MFLGVGLLDHMLILSLVFWGTSILLTPVAAPTYVPSCWTFCSYWKFSLFRTHIDNFKTIINEFITKRKLSWIRNGEEWGSMTHTSKPALEKGFSDLAHGRRSEPDRCRKPWTGPWSLPADWSLIIHSGSQWFPVVASFHCPRKETEVSMRIEPRTMHRTDDL